ncbi:hypothetical protein [Streptomyces sp. SID5606]|uniref:hypothetical protein n=1 Tax=Streptomyces sp. SID5606 TaxID=2690305 RepID=UPI001371A2A3|nr:hypothetical protein [Streptomyces sp. SID5606]MZD56569.1 hypothetical protein [Streptomyces sp. SID5606]
MQTLSTQTLARMIKIGKHLGKSDLLDLLMEANLWSKRIDMDVNRQEILRTALNGARDKAIEDDDTQAHQALLDFARALVEFDLHRELRNLVDDLAEALRSDGYELVDQETDELDRFGFQHKVKILPFDAGKAPLHEEMTALEHELTARGYAQALGHYQAALKHFSEQDHPSSNGQLRTAFEALIVNLAVDHTAYQDTGRANQGGSAIKDLYVKGGSGPAVTGQPLPEKDGGTLIQGVWDISHLNGSHPGLSDAQEARIRMQLVTGVMQFLLRHFPA